jgi:hypothetical protein
MTYYIVSVFYNRITYLSFIIISLFLFISCSENRETKNNYEGPLFTLLNPDNSGVSFINKIPETASMNIIVYPSIYAGAGVSVGDINNDNLPDIFFTANFGNNRLYLNKGNLQFEEIGSKSGVIGAWGWSTGCSMVDINNDGFLDIYISRAGDVEQEKRKNELFINNGDLTFTEQAAKYGLDDAGYSTQSVFVDYDKDGDLDMYLLNAPINTLPLLDYGINHTERDELTSDKLLENDNGFFKDVSEKTGLIGNGIGYGLSASVGDINNDGWPDIYVCNDYIEHDYLYINNQDGTFSEMLKESIKHISNFSMGSDMADFDNDGWLDVITVDMVAEDNYRIKTNMSGMNPKKFKDAIDNGFHYQYMMNTLQKNNGNGTFSEVSQLANISSTDWSWAPLWADFDNDGYKDLLITNGLRKDIRNNDYFKIKEKLLKEMNKDTGGKDLGYIKEALDKTPVNPIKNYIYKNEGNISFINIREEWGLNETSFSNGAAYADLDNDGDLDIVISNIDSKAFVYENNSEKMKDGNFLKVKLNGKEKNKSGIGTRVTIKIDDKFQMKEHYLSRGYLSSVEDNLHFGIGNQKIIDSVWVEWPDGNKQIYTNIEANNTLNVSYKKTEIKELSSLYKIINKQLFSEVTNQININYKHNENDFNDFEKESLLPHKMSILGPAMSVIDLNSDGLDDFYIGGAKGYSGKMYVQNSNGTFKETNQEIWDLDKNSEDMSSLFFDADADGDQDLYIISGGYDFKINSSLLQDRLYLNNGKGIYTKSLDALPEMHTSGGVVSTADFDNDGDLDLFVGGRLVPGNYPKAPRSYLLKNTNGKFEDVTELVAPDLMYPGLVTSSLWTDFNKDGKKDLIVTGEWMPILAFENQDFHFTNVSDSLGLAGTEGWWYSIAEGDFDNDGDIDFIAGNLGLNYKYKARPETKFNVYFDDFDDNSTGDIVLTFNENGEEYPLRGRQCSSEQMPFIKEKFGTYDEFAKANMEDVFGEEKLKKALHLQASTFATSFIENNSGKPWKVRQLPNIVQLSSTNGIIVDDFNNDNNLDIALSGNMFGSEVETPRNDAGNGNLLLGDGLGNFNTLSINESGFYTPRDVKSINKIFIDGVLHIAVVNNNDIIQFFKIN